MAVISELRHRHVDDEKLFGSSSSRLIVSSCLGNMVYEAIRSKKKKGRYTTMTIIILSMVALSTMFGVMYKAFTPN